MRGVNKLVLEIRPDDEMFEKALLFVRPDKLGLPQKNISDNAEKLLSDIKITENNRKSKKIEPIILIFAGAAAGSTISWAIVFMIGMMS